MHPSKKKQILSILAISFICHASALFYLFEFPPLIRIKAAKLFSSGHANVTPIEKTASDNLNEILAEAFDEFLYLPKHRDSTGDSLYASAQPEKEESLLFLNIHEDDSFLNSIIAIVPTEMPWQDEGISQEKQSESDGLSHVISLLSKDLYHEHDFHIRHDSLVMGFSGASELLGITNSVEETLSTQLPPPSHELGLGKDFAFSLQSIARQTEEEKLPTDRNHRFQGKQTLSENELFAKELSYDLPAIGSASWDGQFDTQVFTYSADEDEVYFTIEIKNNKLTAHQNIESTYLFVIDATHKDITLQTRALLKALKYLSKDDLYNVAIIGKKTALLSSKPIPYNLKNFVHTEEFVEKFAQNTSGSSKNFLEGLDLFIQDIDKNKHLCQLFLLSDQAPIKSKKPNSQEENLLKRLIQQAKNKASIHTVQIASNEDTINPVYEALSSTTGGKIILPQTSASYTRKLCALVLDAKSAVLKNLFIDAVADDPSSEISLIPSSGIITHLYERKPLKISGKISKAGSFTLRIKGTNDSELITIEKKIHLQNARKGTRLLIKNYEKATRGEKFQCFSLGEAEFPDRIKLTLPKKDSR